LLPEAGLELQKVVIDTGPNNRECVIHIGERKKGLTLNVGVCDIDGVESRRIVIKYAKEVVIVSQQVLVCLRKPVTRRWRGEAEICYGPEEAVLRRWRLITDRRGPAGVVHAEECRA
jgi:hypothetical protein